MGKGKVLRTLGCDVVRRHQGVEDSEVSRREGSGQQAVCVSRNLLPQEVIIVCWGRGAEAPPPAH